MNTGILVVVALFLIYLAVTGKYPCVTAALRCVALSTAPCDCSQATAAGKAATGAQAQKPGTLESVGKIIQGARDIIGR